MKDDHMKLSAPELTELCPKITVFGVGGAGGNAIKNMIKKGLGGVDFVVANTDAQAIQQTSVDRFVQLGVKLTRGLGAGSKPETGRAAAEESLDEIIDQIGTANMVFITAGMGGGTGTGAAPVIAKAAKERNILTVGVVTTPFAFEGTLRARVAQEGIKEMGQCVDTLLVIPNQNLFHIADEQTGLGDSFAMADNVLFNAVSSVTDLMIKPGLINLDFADVQTVMSNMGHAIMGTGEASGEDRAREAALKAIRNPLLGEVSIESAKGVLINITGGEDMTLFEVDRSTAAIRDEVDEEANIIVGATCDDSVENVMRVAVVATGVSAFNVLTFPPPVTRQKKTHEPSLRRLTPDLFPVMPEGDGENEEAPRARKKEPKKSAPAATASRQMHSGPAAPPPPGQLMSGDENVRRVVKNRLHDARNVVVKNIPTRQDNADIDSDYIGDIAYSAPPAGVRISAPKRVAPGPAPLPRWAESLSPAVASAPSQTEQPRAPAHLPRHAPHKRSFSFMQKVRELFSAPPQEVERLDVDESLAPPAQQPSPVEGRNRSSEARSATKKRPEPATGLSGTTKEQDYSLFSADDPDVPAFLRNKAR